VDFAGSRFDPLDSGIPFQVCAGTLRQDFRITRTAAKNRRGNSVLKKFKTGLPPVFFHEKTAKAYSAQWLPL
jgi:hypothetical protein